MKKYVSIIFILIAQLSFAQLIIRPILKPQNTRARTGAAYAVEPASLPFWDDFSVSNDSVDVVRIWGTDSTFQWDPDSSQHVFVNATLAINPPTYKVVTFDGLNQNGAFHTNPEPRQADQLTSNTINLQGRSDLVLSFYWQAGGNVEIPEEGDSLRLQFYDPNASGEKWITEWLVDGDDIVNGEDTVFTQEAITLKPRFITQKFRFRFQSFGDTDGPFDAWHLDWIYLDDNRSEEEALTGYEEASITQEPTSLISPFNSIPVNQLTSDNKYIKNQETSFSYLNRDAGSVFQIDLKYAVVNKNTGDTLFTHRRAANPLTSTDNYTNAIIGFTGDTLEVPPFRLTEQDFSPIQAFDSVVLESSLSLFNDSIRFLNNTQVDLRVNDTIRTQYLLHNYYAYDDGTAEYAAGTNIDGGQVAVKYWLEHDDTLTHVDIYFPHIDPLSGGSPLELRIFKNLNDNPIRRQNILVENATDINKFTRYELTRPIILSDTFYIGYQQSQNEYIGIGFDRNSIEASSYIYENKTGQWEQNVRLSGALMIRPVFAKVDSLVLGTDPKHNPIVVYPNPTNGVVKVNGNYESISLMDFSGKILVNEKSNKIHDFSSLKAGLYLLTIHRKEGDQTLKIIKK